MARTSKFINFHINNIISNVLILSLFDSFKIVEPSDQLNKLKKTEKSQCVYFFGSHN